MIYSSEVITTQPNYISKKKSSKQILQILSVTTREIGVRIFISTLFSPTPATLFGYPSPNFTLPDEQISNRQDHVNTRVQFSSSSCMQTHSVNIDHRQRNSIPDVLHWDGDRFVLLKVDCSQIGCRFFLKKICIIIPRMYS